VLVEDEVGFLILQGTRARYVAEPLMKTGGAHAHTPGEDGSPHPLLDQFSNQHDH